MIAAVRNVLEAQTLIPGGGDRHFPVVRMHGGRHQNPLRLRLAVRTHRHEAGLGHGGGTVVQRRIGDLHPREARNHRLIFVDQLQRALTRLSLIWRVCAVELATRRECPHRRRDVMLIGSGADEAQRPSVHAGALAHEPADFHLIHLRRNSLQRLDTQGRGNLFKELFDARHPDRGEHRLDIRRSVRNEGHQPPSAARSFS